MGLRELAVEEYTSGLPRLQGARIDVYLPVRRAVLDYVLPLLPGLPRGFALLLGADQQVQVRYGSFYANARLRPEISLRPAPVVTIELASQLVAWGMQTAGLPPFIRVSGRFVHIWLAEIPALGHAAELWAHVDRLTCVSTPAGLQVAAQVTVKAPGPPARPSGPAIRTRGDQQMTDGRLQAWIRDQLAAGLPALAGAKLTGTVPLPVVMLNDLIAQGLADAAAGAAVAASPAVTKGAPDLATLARLVRHVRVEASPGVVTVDFEVGVDG